MIGGTNRCLSLKRQLPLPPPIWPRDLVRCEARGKRHVLFPLNVMGKDGKLRPCSTQFLGVFDMRMLFHYIEVGFTSILWSYLKNRWGSLRAANTFNVPHINSSIDEIKAFLRRLSYVFQQFLWNWCCFVFHRHIMRNYVNLRETGFWFPYVTNAKELAGFCTSLTRYLQSLFKDDVIAVIQLKDYFPSKEFKS